LIAIISARGDLSPIFENISVEQFTPSRVVLGAIGGPYIGKVKNYYISHCFATASLLFL
jgi:hypothetical protein